MTKVKGDNVIVRVETEHEHEYEGRSYCFTWEYKVWLSLIPAEPKRVDWLRDDRFRRVWTPGRGAPPSHIAETIARAQQQFRDDPGPYLRRALEDRNMSTEWLDRIEARHG